MEEFKFARPNPERDRLDQLVELLTLSALGNTQREMLRRMAETGEPLDIIARGLLAYSAEARYALGGLDLEDEEQLAKGKALSREIKQVEWTISLLERVLTPIPVREEEKS